MAAPSFEKDICEKFNISNLTRNQVTSIEAILQGRDVFVGTKTGSGKSLTYECIPVIKPGAIVLIIAPLISIMTEQCRKLTEIGFRATYIGRNVSENEQIESGEFDFVFGSPELLVGDKKWRGILKSNVYQEKLKLIAIDEAHTVISWGEPSKNDDPFREWFSRLGELRSLCPSVPLAALTATSGPSQRRKIMKSLCLAATAAVVLESPDRTNIKISTVSIPNKDNLEHVFEWLINSIKMLKDKMPRHVIFCTTIADVSKLYLMFVKLLGNSCEHFQMFHSKTNEKVKEKIRHDMAMDGKIRILICTNSAGMGVNFYGVHNIIHYGLPREMDTFVQQMGRAGRDGTLSDELVLFKPHKGHMKKVECDLVRFVKDKTMCKHQLLCCSYMTKPTSIAPLHNCCDVCEKKCTCGEEACPRTHVAAVATQHDSDSSNEESMNRVVSSESRELLRNKLEAFKISLMDNTSGALLHHEVIHGLTDTVLSDITLRCEIIFTPEDVMRHFSVWSYDIAIKICQIICDVFGDTEMYDMSDSDSDTLSY